MAFDARHRYLMGRSAEVLGAELRAEIEDCFASNARVLKAFLDGEEPSRLFLLHKPKLPEPDESSGSVQVPTKAPNLLLSTGQPKDLGLGGRCVYFVRVTAPGKAVSTKEADLANDVEIGVVGGASALDSLHKVLDKVFFPLLRAQTEWGKSSTDDTSEFFSTMKKFEETLSNVVKVQQEGIELKRPDKRFAVANNQQAFVSASQESELVAHFEAVVEDWCAATERLLAESEQGRVDSEDAGPDTELDYWRTRMGKFNSVTEQLKLRDCKTTLGVLTQARSKVLKKWRSLDTQITDAANEAKDNVKYLSTLEKYLEPLYGGVPNQIVDSLPGLMNNLKMMHTISRYYNTTERMTTLFVKLTNEMIRNCKKTIKADGKLWDQDPSSLIRKLESCLRLNEAYQEQYRLTKDKLLSQPGARQFDFNELQIFGKFELFCKRVQKLVYVFSTVEQFSALAKHSIDGMENLIKRFQEIVDDLKRKPYDLLDHTKAQFDKDYIDFNKNIEELETALQVFINSSFENITSTENALALLKKFQSILQRENLRADLDSKYMVIFHNYGLDLENVQKTYERYKHNPPLIRNAPPVAGNITWSRQLLRRIEEPMKKFQQNRTIMNTKESKKIIRTYNKVARALVEFETLWHYAWMKSIETAKTGLQATLIVRHPETGRLFVNFDHEILQLIRETKWLLRLGVDVPESAKMVLLQEDKFKSYYNQLSYALKEYDRVTARIIPIVRPIISPHLEDLDKKIQPGMTILTWTSMNIDGYLHRVHSGLARFEELVIKMNDIIENRIEKNLKVISKTLLVDLPSDQTFSLDQFVALQERHIKSQSSQMNMKNMEVERAVDDLMETIKAFALEFVVVPDEVWEEEISKLRKHYNRLMFKAILSATTKSLQIVKKRIGSRSRSGEVVVERPFFNVDVELQPPNVLMNPSLDEVQEAINRAAIAVLRCSKQLFQWSVKTMDPALKESFYPELARNKEIVKVVLLLTGGIHGLKQQVYEYLQTFRQYDYLWKDNKQEAYSEFMKNQPTLEDFEGELKKYMAIEQQIVAINPSHTIGSLTLQTQPLKNAFKSEAAAWKAQYAKNLHAQAKQDLENISNYMTETTKKLQRDISDLEDLRFVMTTLKQIREKESEIDMEVNPVEDMYQLLARYDVRGISKDETDAVAELRYRWKNLVTLANETNERIAQLQGGFKRDLVKAVKQFKIDIVTFSNDYESNGPNVPGIKPHEAMERLNKYKRLFEEKERKFETYAVGEELFGLPHEEYPQLQKVKKELSLLDKLYTLFIKVVERVNSYAEILFEDLDFQAITTEIEGFQKQSKTLPKSLREWEAFLQMKQTIDDFLELQPLLERLSDKAMRPRHWQQLQQITGHTFKRDAEFKLRHLLEAQVLKFRDDIEDLAVSALNEAEIENKLSHIQDDWANQVLEFGEFKNKGPIILRGAEAQAIMEKLEDSQMQLASMMSSRFLTPFRAEVSDWIERLSTVAEVLELWLGVQAMYMYLEAVFTSGDIAKQLPQEAKRFQNIDKTWLKMMAKAFEVRNVVGFAYGNNPLQSLQFMKDQLEICQKSLTGYLEQKRNCFPRFYFVSDPVLLEILSQASDPNSIQKHLQSIFDSIAAVTFDAKQKSKVLVMHSPEGESVNFEHPVVCEGNVEDWLTVMERSMQSTMKSIVRNAAADSGSMGLREFIDQYPSAVALLGIQFIWTADVQEALNRSKTEKRAMSDTNKKVSGIMSDLTQMTTQELTPMNRTKVETLITIQVHQRDVFDELSKKRVRDASDFEWQKQARFYWSTDRDDCVISIADIDFKYSYEYLGCKERLVITPLTDRCYISLSQALGMHLGGAPAGPAGTGKTETVKDLGRTLGKYVVVFNCSDQMDFRAMGKIYKGIAQSGSWGCFDEFNRIKLEVLSVVAQQVQCILVAIRDRQEQFTFTDGQVCVLKRECGFFITMNPGYQGRQELPENLKALYRGVAMMVPDRRIIIKVKLAACGFEQNENLSIKFNILYALCEQQLSKQPHYDFGLRNILSVLRTAGATKRKNPDKSEPYLLMRTLRDMNTSKLVAEDVPLFLSLINDLFPGMKADKARFPEIEASIQSNIEKSGLQNHGLWIEKVIQLYETSVVRHGIMVVGPSGAGKSRCFEILLKALSECVKPHKELRMNPKAMTAEQMFGRLDPISNDWTDGIFSALWRKANDKTQMRNTVPWLICDGPVDAIWIENLNTVLDDNKLLTLANGDRIQMSPEMKMCFEVENLNNASPATVSRAGQIYMSESVLGWEPVLKSHMFPTGAVKEDARRITCKDSEAMLLSKLFDQHVADLLTFSRKECVPVMGVSELNQIMTMYDLLMPLLRVANEASGGCSDMHVERLFWFTAWWSIGGLLETKDRTRFSEFISSRTKQSPPSDNGSMCFDFFVDDVTGAWTHWRSRIPSWEYPGDSKFEFSTLFVPTLDSVRLDYLLGIIAKQEKSVLLVGGPGTAKTVTIENYLITKSDPETMLYKKINFSSATSPLIFQRTIEANIDKRVGNTYGPAAGRKMTVFVDDISMPEINEWGDQVTNEIVRQVVESRGVYNLEKPGEWKKIVDVQFLAAMNHPGGGKNDIPARLKRHFAIFNVTLPSHTAIDQIYGAVLRGRFCSSAGFDEETVGISTKLTPSTILLWERVAAKMLPTPSKVHYIFNMRDLSRVFQGVMQCPPNIVANAEILLKLWRHECNRVFSDRLNTVEDKIWFDDAMQKLVVESFGTEFAEKTKAPAYFVDFLRDAREDPETGEALEPRPDVYEPVVSREGLTERLYMFMKKFNETSKVRKLDLVLFDAAVKHLIRIARILRLPRGNALLVGVGGSGRQSVTRLASYIRGYDTFQITLTKTYNATNLCEDLQRLYKTTGVEGKPVTFLFTDNEIKDESFLEYVNNILSSGEIAGLFPKEELDAIVNELRDVAKKTKPDTLGKNDTYDNLYRFFIDRVRDNLHIVLCFSPVGEKFRTRARKFPGLISGCIIDWFFPWPEEALTDVAAKMLGAFKMECTDPVRSSLIKHMANIHRSMSDVSAQYFQRFRRNVYTTPKSYLSFLENFKAVYSIKYEEVQSLARKINSGLEKLMKAGSDVERMKIELAEKEVNLKAAQKETEEMLIVIADKTAKAEKKREDVQKVKDVLSEDAAIVAKGKAEAEHDLAAAKPALEQAENALKAITAKDIQNLRALRNPPQLVKVIFDGVLLLRKMPLNAVEPLEYKGNNIIKDSYTYSVQMMTDTNFLNSLLNYERDEVTDEMVELCQPYFDIEEWDADKARAASGNVAGLCTWVSSICLYHDVAKIVQPKIEALRVAEVQLRVANSKLKAKQEELDQVEADLFKIQSEFDAMMRKKQELQDDADRTRKRMESANNLIGALAGEKDRWTQQSKEFADRTRRLIGDVGCVCAFISYCGPYNAEFRNMLLNKNFYDGCKQRNIPVTEGLGITKFLVDESQIGEWNLEGLPTDDHSVQNGIMVTRSSKWPLLVDPQGQGLAWLKRREASNEVVVVELTYKHFRNVLEDCITFGRSLIIENVEEELDPFLDPVLDKAVTKTGRSMQITLADKQVTYNDNFRLFVTTKLANPHFSPELSAKTTIIDFTVTMGGLEQQLLGRVIQMEKAELEEQREQLLQEVNANQKKIKALEDDLLKRLSESQGNLLDDEELIGVLANTKRTASEVQENLVKAVDMEKRINASREEYRPVAIRGSVLYFLIVEMSLVSSMYQTSLKQFLVLFDLAVERAERALITTKRIHNIIEAMTFGVYVYVNRGLFERHKLLFVLLLACKILLRDGLIDGAQFSSMLKGGAALDINAVRKKPFAWLPDAAWLNCVQISYLNQFRELPDMIQRNETLWKQYYDAEAPEETKIPEIHDRLSSFERLLVVRSLREDRTTIAASDFIRDILGQRYVDAIPLNLESTWEESKPLTPMIFLLSAGSDPTAAIEALAKRKKKFPIRAISMGQGQEEAARKLIQAGFQQGHWVLLQNCHLGLDFMIEIEKLLASLAAAQAKEGGKDDKSKGKESSKDSSGDMEGSSEISPEFRLWITTEPHPKFSIGLLQMSIKLTNEAPQGVKAGLKRSYQWISQDMLESFQRPEWKPLLYSICFLHTIVQERRKFGPLGWNIPYEFNQTDLSASVRFMQNHIASIGDDVKRGAPISWQTVKYMICEVQYGGRITDDFDRRLFNTYGQDFLDPRVFPADFAFYAGAPGYTIPRFDDITKIRDFIEQMPLNDHPEVFGLHKNADIAYLQRRAKDSLNTILDIQPKDAGAGSGETPEQFVLRVADDMLGRLPADFSKDKAKDALKRMGGATPVNIIVGQEIDRLQVVIGLVRRTLKDLKLAISGTIIMSSVLQNALVSIFDSKVPSAWLKVSWVSSTLGNWFTSLLNRSEQFTRWLEVGRPKVIWLTGFMNPQGLLTAVRQEVTRAHQWALDDIVLRTEVIPKEREEVKDGPSEGIYIYGLFLEGAAWHKAQDKLVDQPPKILYHALPVLYVTAVQSSAKKQTGNQYKCPVYTNPARTDRNYVFTVDLRCQENPSFWTLRGVALLCTTA
eukprot:ANDGO_03248.mRNA.1 Dynein gamma chain